MFTTSRGSHSNSPSPTPTTPNINVLKLAPSKSDDFSSITIKNTKVTACFADILIPTEKCIPMIPYYSNDGMLYNLFLSKNKSINSKYTIVNNFNNGVHRVESDIPNIPYALCFTYEEVKLQNWNIIFESAAKILNKDDVLVIPAIGTNNNISFWQSAISIFYGITLSLDDDDSPLHKLSEIKIVSLHSTNWNNSCRVIQHLFNLIKIRNITKDEPECIVCLQSKISCILPCGHRVLCRSCSVTIKRSNSTCPICRASFLRDYDCYKIKEESTFDCCSKFTTIENNESKNTKEKVSNIFAPCGHFKTCCVDCGPKFELSKNCPICEELIETYIPLFM
jgi:hypothetical protein